MGRLKWWLLAGLAGLFVAYLAWVGWRGPEVKLYRVTQAELMQTIVASGHVQNPNRIEVSEQITSTVDSVPVKEGEFVKKGQLLISLNSHEAQAGLQVAKAAAKSAQLHLQQLHQVNEPVAALALLQADANLVVSQRNYQRTKELYEQSFVGLAAKEESERLWLIAQSQSLINKKQWLSLQASGSEISSAESNLQEALANVNVALAKLAYTRILAARSGVLISRHVEAGDAVQPGKPLLVHHGQHCHQVFCGTFSRVRHCKRVGSFCGATFSRDRHFARHGHHQRTGVAHFFTSRRIAGFRWLIDRCRYRCFGFVLVAALHAQCRWHGDVCFAV